MTNEIVKRSGHLRAVDVVTTYVREATTAAEVFDRLGLGSFVLSADRQLLLNPKVKSEFAQAVLAALLIALLGISLVRQSATRADGAAVLAVLALQLCLGVSIVWFGVPLGVAVLHNGVAALLLLAVINANQRIRQR